MAATTAFQEHVLPIVENAATLVALFFLLSPAVQVRQVSSTKGETLHTINPTNILSMFMNCALWVIYGVYLPMPPAVPANVVGVCACLYYLGTCWWFARRRPQNPGLWGRNAAFGTVASFALTLVFWAYAIVDSTAAGHVGYMGMTFNIIMYGAPLSVIGQVFRDQSSAALPLLQCILGFLCSALWLTVGLAKNSLPIAVPNGAGLVLAGPRSD